MKRKVGEQWNKIFMEIFKSMSLGFLLLSPVSLTELCSFCYGLKDLFTLHKLVDQVVLFRTGGSGANGLSIMEITAILIQNLT